jgi:hypothetical protein
MTTLTDLTTEINALLGDNTTAQITPAKVRTVLVDMVARLVADDTGGGGGGGGPITATDIATTSGTAGSTTALYGDNSWKVPTVDVSHIATSSGAPSSSTILYGDNSWKTAPSGGSGGTTTITGGGLGFNFDSRAAAISATIATVASGGPNWIRTSGYASSGDGGGDLYVRVSSIPAYSTLIWFTSADGQKWGLPLTSAGRLFTNEPFKLEQAGGGTAATGAANNAAVEAINSIFTTNKYGQGYGLAGAWFRLGYGTYNFAGPWFVKGGCKIEGMGSAFYGGYSTTLQFPAGSDGFVLGAAGSNGRLYNPSIYGDFDGRSTVIRDMYVRGGWDGGTRYLDDRTTGMRGIGVLSKAPIFMTDVVVGRFAEFGVYIKGTAGGGGSATEPAFGTAGNDDPSESYVAVHGYANSFMLFHVNCDENGVDGFRIRGADANAGSIIGCSATLNCGWGYNDLCFLGNWYWGNHAASNGIRDEHDANSGKQFGAYQCYSDSQYTTFVANYSEGDFAGRASFFTGFMNILGGLMAGGYHQTPSGIIFNQGTGGLYIGQHHTPTIGGTLTWGAGNVDGEVCNLNGDIFWRTGFGRYDQGSFGTSDLFSQTMSGYTPSMGRSTGLGGGNLLFGHGFWLGGPQINQGFDQRFTGMSDGLPTAGKWARGDFIRMVNPSAGGIWAYVCTSGGDYAGTPPVWKSVGNAAA